jgi:hypothetical protein
MHLARVVGAVASGFALTWYGPELSFGIAAVIAALCVIPVFYMPDLHGGDAASDYRPRMKKLYRLLVAQGFHAAAWFHIWPIVVFVLVGASFSSFGLLLGLVGFMEAIGWYAMGNRLDNTDRRVLAIVGSLATLGVVLGRIFLSTSVFAVVVLDACAVVALLIYSPLFQATAYDLIRDSQALLRASYWHELGWETGAVSAFGLTGLLLLYGYDIRMGLLLGGVGTLASGWLLVSHYRTARL